MLYIFFYIGGNWGGGHGGFGGGPMRGNFGNNRAAPYHTGGSGIIFMFANLLSLYNFYP